MSLEDLQHRLDGLRARQQQIDMPVARSRVARAQTEWDQQHLSAAGNPTGSGVFGVVPQMNEARVARDAASVELKAARGALTRLEEEDRALRLEISSLERMLSGAKLVEDALADLGAVDAVVGDAEQRVQAAEQALARVVTMIDQEKRDATTARAQAAEQLLDALNSGDVAAKVPAQSAGANLETLALTKTAAERQVEVARKGLQAANGQRAGALRKVHEARAAVTALAFHVARAAYVQALSFHMAAYWRAYRESFGDADARNDAIAASQRLLEAEGY